MSPAGTLLVFALAAAVDSLPPAPAPAAPAAPSWRPGRGDAAFALATAAGVALVATRDRTWSGDAARNDTRFALDLAADARRLGDTYYLAAGLLAVDGVARLTGRAALAGATERVAFAVAATGVTTYALKQATGRMRPDESPADAARWRPFSGHDAMPSGHASTAFALITALHAETRSRWVPALGYPLAALTAWSRVRDRRHWPSDVLAGAATGVAVARRADAFARGRWPRRLVLTAGPRERGARAAAHWSF